MQARREIGSYFERRSQGSGESQIWPCKAPPSRGKIPPRDDPGQRVIEEGLGGVAGGPGRDGGGLRGMEVRSCWAIGWKTTKMFAPVARTGLTHVCEFSIMQ